MVSFANSLKGYVPNILILFFVYIYFHLFIYWSGYLMFSISLTTMHLSLDLALLLHVCPNHKTISFFHRPRSLLNIRFRPLRYHSIIAHIHLSVNLVTCLAQRNFYFQYSVIAFFILLCSRITSLRMCSRNNILGMDHSQTPFVKTVYVPYLWLPTFRLNIR